MTVVMDTSAVLAALRDEIGADKATQLMSVAKISSVNVVEIVGKLVDFGLEPDDAERDFRDIGLQIVVFDEEMAVTAGRLRATTRHLGLSLGDRACLALAIHEKASVITADRAWVGLDVGCKIEVIR